VLTEIFSRLIFTAEFHHELADFQQWNGEFSSIFLIDFISRTSSI
jgi:hypothetical protein